MNSMEISNYLEKIRYGRKISQESFVDGVCSLRQYQRYRSGECEITYEKIDNFAKKLGIPTKKLMNEFEREMQNQSEMLDRFYNAVVNKDTTQVIELKSSLDKETIFDEERKMYYKHALIMNDLYSGKLSKEETITKTQGLVNYPTILKQNYFTDVEILILSFLMSIVGKDEQTKLLKKLTQLYDNKESIMSGGGNHATFLILMRLAQISGIHKDFPKVIRFCDLGIQRGILFKQYYLMDYFFYYKALAHFKLEEFASHEEALFKCYNVLHMEGNKKKIDKFTSLIESDFKIVYDMFILRYLKKSIV